MYIIIHRPLANLTNKTYLIKIFLCIKYLNFNLKKNRIVFVCKKQIGTDFKSYNTPIYITLSLCTRKITYLNVKVRTILQ